MNHRKPLSRFYPAYHPMAGQPTYFCEKVWNSIHDQARVFFTNYYSIITLNEASIISDKTKLTAKHVEDFWAGVKYEYNELPHKGHTIRAGSGVKVGDTLELYVWADRPYASPQIIVTPKIEVRKVWDFEIKYENLQTTAYLGGEPCPADTVGTIARNDGLSFVDMMHWFKYPASTGPMQIICWNDKIQY